jgi:GT2 family glycosyltransferase
MIRAGLFRRLSGFDTDFFMYFEETELTYRLKKIGFEVYSVPQVEIIHLEGKSFNTNEKRAKMILSGRNLFYKKTRSWLYHTFVNCIFRLTAISRIVIFTILNNKEKRRYWTFTLKNINE